MTFEAGVLGRQEVYFSITDSTHFRADDETMTLGHCVDMDIETPRSSLRGCPSIR